MLYPLHYRATSAGVDEPIIEMLHGLLFQHWQFHAFTEKVSVCTVGHLVH